MQFNDSLLERAVKCIASRCNNTTTTDECGFNKLDAQFGNSMAQLPISQWTQDQKETVYKMLAKYQEQLVAYGIQLNRIKIEDGYVPPIPKASKKIILDKNAIVLEPHYDTEILSDFHQTFPLVERKLDRKKQKWNWCLSIHDKKTVLNVKEFANRHGFEISLDLQVLIERLTEEEKKAQKFVELSQASEADVGVEGLHGELRPFQKAAVLYATQKKRTFLCDEMGLGKTVEAIASIHKLQAYPCIVVCPASLKLNWEREINKWLPHKRSIVLNGESINNIDAQDFVILNYNILGKWIDVFEQINTKGIIIDESHYIKNYKTIRYKNSEQLTQNIPVILLLTGTPILNRPSELITQLTILGKMGAGKEFGTIYNFEKQYCGMHRRLYGTEMKGATNLDELNKKLRASCYIRRKKEEVLKELPPKQRSIIPIEIDNRKNYESAENDLVAWVQKKAIENEKFLESIKDLPEDEQSKLKRIRWEEAGERAARAEALVRIEALKQLTAQGKMKSILEWFENFLDSGEKLVAFAHHRNIVEQLSKEFNAPSITGDTPIQTRQDYIDRFQKDESCRLIVCNIRAGGLGITLTASSNVAFVELGWTPAEHSQAEDRCHRIGQMDSVTAWYLLGKNTIDADIYELIEEKRIIVNAVTDGKGEVVQTSIFSELMDRLMKKVH